MNGILVGISAGNFDERKAENMNILIAVNTKFLEPASVMVYSLCRNHRDTEVDIYLAYHDLREQDVKRLQKIISCFRKKKLHLLDVGGEFAARISRTDQFSYEHIIVSWQ